MVFVFAEGAPHHRLDAEDVEDAGRDAPGLDALRLGAAGEIHVIDGDTTDRGKRAHPLAVIEVLQRADADALEPGNGHVALLQRDDARRIAIRQRAQQHGVEHAEHGGVGADSDRQREQRYDGESGGAKKATQPVTDVLKERVHEITPWEQVRVGTQEGSADALRNRRENGNLVTAELKSKAKHNTKGTLRLRSGQAPVARRAQRKSVRLLAQF